LGSRPARPFKVEFQRSEGQTDEGRGGSDPAIWIKKQHTEGGKEVRKITKHGRRYGARNKATKKSI